ncbi:hypothetical protein [Mesorhizobium sangaii]|uniref:DUF5655 domain-containing protein n=1 Tax=Mesorhizobium sangaii TaxID=505389 RepID=A0A841PE66_9HYPH|nr:hypothetical protein [Mesorhizobium sangaii]MBB6411863.1 hypothetical protein [Mesorhizobium sangaii]
MLKYVKGENILLRAHPDFGEKWVQARIADDPSILGLGNLVLRDQERRQPGAGRLDLLLQDPDTLRRYELELQLGATDETHIIRTIEYWDIERRRYPQYEHCAVIVAEDITSRFLSVLALFNGTVPLIAIKMQAVRIGDDILLVFTTVLNELKRGLIDEDEDAAAVPADRAYWENERGSKETVAMADEILKIVHEFQPDLQLKYNKFYIGLAANDRANNFIYMKPRKRGNLQLGIRLPPSSEVEKQIEETGIDAMGFDPGDAGTFRLRLNKGDVKKHHDLLRSLLEQAHEFRNG